MRGSWCGRRRMLPQILLLMAVTSMTGGALADETVTLTTFYPQQPAQTFTLPAATAGPAGFTDLMSFNTTAAGRLLILWSLDVTNPGGVPATVQAQVYLNGVASGGVSTVAIPNGNTYTMSGYRVVVPATAGSTPVALRWRVTAGAATANGANTTLSVVELK